MTRIEASQAAAVRALCDPLLFLDTEREIKESEDDRLRADERRPALIRRAYDPAVCK